MTSPVPSTPAAGPTRSFQDDAPRHEELANCITHALGLLASVVALPIVVVAAIGRRDPWHIVGASVFGASLIALYAASSVYHGLRPSAAKRVLRLIDHSAIYLLIAGTYTPFALGALRGPWGWSLLGVAWGLAATGIVLKWWRGVGPPWLSTAMYVGMGWMAIVAARPLVTRVGWEGVGWLLAGGLCYTAGVAFYLRDHRIRFGHAVWHVFVLAGSACHFVAVLLHSAGGTA